MEPFVVLLVLFSALLHATWNAFLHLSEDRVWLLGMMAMPYIAVSAIGVLVLPPPAPAAWPFIVASAVLEWGYLLALIRAYNSGDFGEIYPSARSFTDAGVRRRARVRGRSAEAARRARCASGATMLSARPMPTAVCVVTGRAGCCGARQSSCA
jgi:hypothetical protein